MLRRGAQYLVKLGLTLLLGGLLAATMVRMGPGFAVDQRELDPRLRAESIEAIRQARGADSNVVRFYFQYLRAAVHGDLGFSRALNRPVAELLAARVPVTLRTVGLGLLFGWLAGLALALGVVLFRSPLYDFFSTSLAGLFLCIPSAVLALLFLFVTGPVPLAIGLVIFPRVFRYSRNLLVDASARPHVLMAHAKGLGRGRVLLWHILPPAGPQILALAGVSVSMAFGAAIPIEVICDSAGIGQLAWQAAMARDMVLLVNITILVTLITILANGVSDLANEWPSMGQASSPVIPVAKGTAAGGDACPTPTGGGQ